MQLTILHAALKRPGIYLRELQTEVFVLTGVEVSVSSLCTFLKESNFTRQRMWIVAKQQDKELREQFAIDVSLYHAAPHAHFCGRDGFRLWRRCEEVWLWSEGKTP